MRLALLDLGSQIPELTFSSRSATRSFTEQALVIKQSPIHPIGSVLVKLDPIGELLKVCG